MFSCELARDTLSSGVSDLWRGVRFMLVLFCTLFVLTAVVSMALFVPWELSKTTTPMLESDVVSSAPETDSGDTNSSSESSTCAVLM